MELQLQSFTNEAFFSSLNQKMINGMTVSRWACINFSRSVQENVARGFCAELAQMCQVSGMVSTLLSHFQQVLFGCSLVLKKVLIL